MNLRVFLQYSFIGVFSPLAMLLFALRSRNVNYKKWGLILFITIYGSIIFINESNDGFRHQQNVYEIYSNMSFSEFFSGLFSILTFQTVEGTRGDVFIHVLSFFVGAILKAPKLFFVFVAFIYGYFYSSSIFLIAQYVNLTKRSRFLFFIFALFIFWKNIEGINTVRTWTGLWILFYAVLHFQVHKKLKYLIWVLVPPLVHFSYFLMGIPAWIVLFFGKFIPQRAYFFIFFLSFAFSFNSSTAVEYVESTELGQSRRGYVLDESNEGFLNQRQEVYERRTMGPWYLSLNERGFHKIGYIILILGLFLTTTRDVFKNFEFQLLNVGMLNIAMANYLSFIFAVKNRSSIIGEVFILGFLVIFIARNLSYESKTWHYKRFESFVYLAVIFFIPFIFYKLADVIYYVSVYLIAFPFIPWLEETTNISIREFLGLFIK